MKEKRAVYYTINNDPLYILFAATSIKSLRKFNKKVKIYLFIYGDLIDLDLSFFHKNKVNIINKKNIEFNEITDMKFFALGEFSNHKIDRLIAIDADTFCFQDIEILFKKFSKFDYYAREEFRTNKNERDCQLQIDHTLYQKIIRKLKVRSLPIFNTGICIFNNQSFRKIVSVLDFYSYISKCFKEKKLPLPSDNPMINNEIVTSIAFGKIPDFTYGIIDSQSTPWYKEFLDGKISKPGIIIHFWSYYYRCILLDILESRYPKATDLLYSHILNIFNH